MNARQKAKKYKRECQRLRDLINYSPVNIVSTTIHPKTIKYKCPITDLVTDDMVKGMIAQYFGRYLMENGFIDVNMTDNKPEFDNNIINYRFVEAYMVAMHPQEYTLGGIG